VSYYNTKESGNRIKELRRRKGITQETLAERLGISREFLGRVENGKSGASVDLLVTLSFIFNVSLDYLVLGREQSISFSENEKKKALKALGDLLVLLERDI